MAEKKKTEAPKEAPKSSTTDALIELTKAITEMSKDVKTLLDKFEQAIKAGRF